MPCAASGRAGAAVAVNDSPGENASSSVERTQCRALRATTTASHYKKKT